MASIKNTPGTLSPPACYASEQERFEAYVAKIISTIIGGLQWEAGNAAPVDLGLFWLRLNSDTRPRGPRQYSAADGRWIPWLEVPLIPDSSGGGANAYTITTGHNLTTAAVQITGRRVLFTAAATNTGASTLAVDGTSAVALVRDGGNALQAGAIISGGIYEAVYNAAGGGRWEIQSPMPVPADQQPVYITTAEFAVPAAASFVEVSHSEAKVPFAVRVVAVCKTGVNGYSVGDELAIEGIAADFSASDEDGPAYLVSANTTKITVSAATAANGQTYPARTGGNADWGAASANFMLKAYLTFLP